MHSAASHAIDSPPGITHHSDSTPAKVEGSFQGFAREAFPAIGHLSKEWQADLLELRRLLIHYYLPIDRYTDDAKSIRTRLMALKKDVRNAIKRLTKCDETKDERASILTQSVERIADLQKDSADIQKIQSLINKIKTAVMAQDQAMTGFVLGFDAYLDRGLCADFLEEEAKTTEKFEAELRDVGMAIKAKQIGIEERQKVTLTRAVDQALYEGYRAEIKSELTHLEERATVLHGLFEKTMPASTELRQRIQSFIDYLTSITPRLEVQMLATYVNIFYFYQIENEIPLSGNIERLFREMINDVDRVIALSENFELPKDLEVIKLATFAVILFNRMYGAHLVKRRDEEQHHTYTSRDIGSFRLMRLKEISQLQQDVEKDTAMYGSAATKLAARWDFNTENPFIGLIHTDAHFFLHQLEKNPHYKRVEDFFANFQKTKTDYAADRKKQLGRLQAKSVADSKEDKDSPKQKEPLLLSLEDPICVSLDRLLIGFLKHVQPFKIAEKGFNKFKEKQNKKPDEVEKYVRDFLEAAETLKKLLVDYRVCISEKGKPLLDSVDPMGRFWIVVKNLIIHLMIVAKNLYFPMNGEEVSQERKQKALELLDEIHRLTTSDIPLLHGLKSVYFSESEAKFLTQSLGEFAKVVSPKMQKRVERELSAKFSLNSLFSALVYLRTNQLSDKLLQSRAPAAKKSKKKKKKVEAEAGEYEINREDALFDSIEKEDANNDLVFSSALNHLEKASFQDIQKRNTDPLLSIAYTAVPISHRLEVVSSAAASASEELKDTPSYDEKFGERYLKLFEQLTDLRKPGGNKKQSYDDIIHAYQQFIDEAAKMDQLGWVIKGQLELIHCHLLAIGSLDAMMKKTSRCGLLERAELHKTIKKLLIEADNLLDSLSSKLNAFKQSAKKEDNYIIEQLTASYEGLVDKHKELYHANRTWLDRKFEISLQYQAAAHRKIGQRNLTERRRIAKERAIKNMLDEELGKQIAQKISLSPAGGSPADDSPTGDSVANSSLAGSGLVGGTPAASSIVSSPGGVLSDRASVTSSTHVDSESDLSQASPVSVRSAAASTSAVDDVELPEPDIRTKYAKVRDQWMEFSLEMEELGNQFKFYVKNKQPSAAAFVTVGSASAMPTKNPASLHSGVKQKSKAREMAELRRTGIGRGHGMRLY